MNGLHKDTDKDSLIQKNIIGSIILKATSILISFYLVRVAIGFVDETQYGIWLTLSSLIVWFNYFDIGLTHGFRNRFAETLARRDLVMAKIFVSTTYASLIIISILIMSIFLPINKLIDWCEILKINEIYFHELKIVVIILVITFAVSFFMQTISTIVTADQRPVLASLIQVSGQALSLLIICIAKYTIHKGNLIYLTLILTVSPLIILLISSLLLFNTRYKKYRPTFKCIRFKYLRDILGIGGKFFVIGVAMLFIFQLMNVIISRNMGPTVVTEYNIAYKYFNTMYMLAVIIINPYWSAFTDAYVKKDFFWMKKQLKRLEGLWIISIPAIFIMVFLSNWFYKIWLGDNINIGWDISIPVAFYTSVLILSNIYMYLINGIGKVQIQLMIYVSFAVISYPLMSYGCKHWGITGLLITPSLVYILQAILGRIQMKKILNETTSGIWDK